MTTAAMNVELSEPVLVAEAPAGETRWGRHQFPTLDRMLDGRIALTFHVGDDSALEYGQAPREPNRGVSADEGQTWTLERASAPTAGLLLPNGDRIRAGCAEVTPPSFPVGELSLPQSIGTIIGTYGQLPYTYYRHSDLPAALQGVPIMRLARGTAQWIAERAPLDDPGFHRYTVQDVFPIVWWGDLHIAADGSILALVYPRSMNGDVACHRSTDSGHSWHFQGHIPYTPDLRADPLARGRSHGFTEPGSALLADGSLLVMLRTTDGLGIGPLYASRSTDAGKTWSAPTVVNASGVLPRLLPLRNGVLALSYGRPGVELRLSFDGLGATWSEPIPLVPLTAADTQADSCGYTSLLPLTANSFLIAYSWFKRPGRDGQPHKAVLVRRVTVGPGENRYPARPSLGR